MRQNHYFRDSGEFQFVSDDQENSILEDVQFSLNTLNNAYVNHDTDAISRMMTSDHVTITPSIYYVSKSEVMETVKQYDLKEYHATNLELRLLNPATVLATFKAQVLGWFGPVDVSGNYQVSALWVKRRGSWKEAWYQETWLGH